MESYVSKFSGRLLDRGFWIYVWRIRSNADVVLYVGRTGDSSSPNAASPFGRLSQHLDLRDNATANTLVRNLRGRGLDPTECDFEMLAIGPLYPEQATLDEHYPFRDRTAVLESELAAHLRQAGHIVLGTHPRRGDYDTAFFIEIRRQVEAFLND